MLGSVRSILDMVCSAAPRRAPLARFAAALAAYGFASAGAFAHPHVWVTAKTAVIFDAEGKATALRQEWTFDELYSSFLAQGLESKDGVPTKAALTELVVQQMSNLKEFGWFTYPKVAGHPVGFGAPRDASLEIASDKLATLRFTLPLERPASAARAFTFQVFDPSYFVDFTFADAQAVTLEGAPKGCSVSVVAPAALAQADAKAKDESFFTGLAPGANFGAKLASRAVVACP